MAHFSFTESDSLRDSGLVEIEEGWWAQSAKPRLREPVAVVDHLLEPNSSMQHPHYDEAILVAGGKLSEGLIPSDHHDVALVPLKRLVHGQIVLHTAAATSTTTAALRCICR